MGTFQNKNKPEASPAEIKHAGQFAAALVALIKAVNLYPKGHQTLLQVTEKFSGQLKETLSQRQLATFRIFENSLFVNNVLLPIDKISGLKEFVETMQNRYVRQIIFYPATTITDISALVDMLAALPEKISIAGGACAVLAQTGKKNIKIIEYYSQRNIEVDQERLLDLTSSAIFRFLIDDSVLELNTNDTCFLYELLKESKLIYALIKIAAQYIIRDSKNPLNEPMLISKILSKITRAVLSIDISEEIEMKTILKDILDIFEDKEIFDFVFFNIDSEIVSYSDSIAYVAARLNMPQIAEFSISNIVSFENLSQGMSISKTVLTRLFCERKDFLDFLTILKQALQKTPLTESKKQTILNEICSAIAPGTSLEDDVELALGNISESDMSDISSGLKLLKSVHLEKTALKRSVLDFDLERTHATILQTLISTEKDPELFKKMLELLNQHIQALLEKKSFARVKIFFNFFLQQTRKESLLPPAHKQDILKILGSFHADLLEQLIIAGLEELSFEKAQEYINDLLELFKEKLFSLLIKLYTHAEKLPQSAVVKDIIIQYYSTHLVRFPFDVKKEASANILRVIDLLQKIKKDEILPILWEILSHEDTIIIQRALKTIALKNSQPALALLIKAIQHPNQHLRLAAIEYLSQFKSDQVSAILSAIVRAENGMGEDQNMNLQLRQTALSALAEVDGLAAKALCLQILQKKRFFIIPVEKQPLRLFARKQLEMLKK